MNLYDRRRYDYFRRLEKSQMEKFTDLIAGHSFEIIDVDKTPKGKWCKCAFCGQYCKYYVLLKRDDGVKVNVGRTCLNRAGLYLRKEHKEKVQKLQEKAETDDLLKLLDDL